MALRIYELRRKPSKTLSGGRDEAYGFVVAARSAKHARTLVTTARDRDEEGPGDEGDVWADDKLTTATVLGAANRQTKAGVIMRDFMAG